MVLIDLDVVIVDIGLWYMVYLGELFFSVGGNIGINVGGMCVVKYGVVCYNVFGL